MGYYTRFSGEITIDPPLHRAQFDETKWAAEDDRFRNVKFVIEGRLDEAGVMVPVATGVVPAHEDAYKGYTMLEELRELVAKFPEHAFVGELRGEGEESGDIRRYVVRDGAVDEWQASLTWPDGSSEAGR
jgi:hypothetical protein